MREALIEDRKSKYNKSFVIPITLSIVDCKILNEKRCV